MDFEPEFEDILKRLESNDPKLTRLDLSGNPVDSLNPYPLYDLYRLGDDGAKKLARALRHNTQVTKLLLPKHNIGPEGMCALADVIKTNRMLKLEEIELNNNPIGDEGAARVVEMLKGYDSLNSLDLGFCNLGDKGVCALVNVLRNNNALISLDLRRNDIHDQTAHELAQLLKDSRSLRSLILAYNRIGSAGACAFAEALETNNTLEWLILRTNDIDDEGARALLEVFKRNQNLVIIDVEGNKVDPGLKGEIEEITGARIETSAARKLEVETALPSGETTINALGQASQRALGSPGES